jgi:hypothetical protein
VRCGLLLTVLGGFTLEQRYVNPAVEPVHMTSRRFWSPWLSCSAVRSRRRRSRQSRHAGAWRCRLLPTFPGGCKAGGTSAGRMVCSKSVFKEFHGRRRPLPARRGVRKRRKQTEVKPGKRIQGIPQAFKAYRGRAHLLSDGAENGPHSWRLRGATF